MPTYVNTAHVDVTSTGVKNIPVPSGTSVGDRLHVNISGTGSGTDHAFSSIPSGWEQLGSTLSGSQGCQSVITGIYDGSTPQITFTEIGNGCNMSTIAIADAAYRDVYSQASESSVSTTHTTNSITPSANGAFLVASWAGEANIITGTQGSPFVEADDYEYWGHNYTEYYSQVTAASISASFTDDLGEQCVGLIVAYLASAPYTIDQEGFAWGADDGSESAHTIGTQDADISTAIDTTKILRGIVNADGDPGAIAYTLYYQKNGSGGYAAVPVGSVISGSPTDTADKFPSSGTTQDRSGATAWTSPGNITADDTSYSTATVPTDYLIATGFDFSEIPDGSAINGVTVKVNASESGSGSSNYIPQLVSASTPTLIGSAKSAVTVSGTTKVTSTNGGTADTWGATLNTTIVKSSGFGVAIWSTDTVNTLSVDWITISINYTPPDVDNEMYVIASANITNGEATTARLTAPAGKSGNFTAGRAEDTSNGGGTVDITEDYYSELLWVLHGNPAGACYFDFEIYAGGAPFDTYTEIPRWTFTDGGTTVNVTDSGAGADATPGIAVGVALSDSGAGVSSLGPAASVPVADSSAAVDSPTLAVTVPLTDSGSASDAIGVLIALTKSISDAGTAVSAINISAAAAITDTASGVSTPAITAVLSLADSSAGLDAVAAAVLIAIADLASGTAVPGITAVLTLPEIGGGADDITNLTASLSLTDSGSGNDTTAVTVTLTVTDTAGGAEAINIATAAIKSVTDSGTAVSAISLSVQAAVADSGVGSETTAVSVSFSLADAGAAAEAVNVITATLVSIGDTGAGLAAISIGVQTAVNDAGAGSDQTAVVVTLEITDVGAGLETVSAIIATLVADAGAGTAVLSIGAAISLADAAAGSDTPGVTVSLSVGDVGAGADDTAVLIALFKAVADSAAGSDAVSSVTVTVPITDAGAATDTINQLLAAIAVSDLASAAASIGVQTGIELVTICIVFARRTMVFSLALRTMDFSLSERTAVFALNERTAEFVMTTRSVEFELSAVNC